MSRLGISPRGLPYIAGTPISPTAQRVQQILR